MDGVLIEVLKPLGVGLGIVLLLWWLYRLTDKRQREAEIRLREALSAAEAQCRKDRDELAARLREVEDFTRKELVPVARDCAAALRELRRYIERSGTDRFRQGEHG